METYLSYRERLEISKRERAAVLKRRAVILALCLMIIFGSVFAITQYAAANTSKHRIKTFASVEIKSGDSLWTIAEQYYSDEYSSITSYISEIMKTNHLYEEEITSGSYIIVPFYTDNDTI